MKLVIAALIAHILTPTLLLSAMCCCMGSRKKILTEKTRIVPTKHNDLLLAAQHNDLTNCTIILEKALPGERSMLLQASNILGYTPLHLACLNNNTQLGILLVSKGAVVNTRDAQGRTPLYYAAMVGNETLVQRLLEMGAVIDAKEETSPLTAAAQRGHLNIIALFLAGPLLPLFVAVEKIWEIFDQCTLCKDFLDNQLKGSVIGFHSCQHVVHQLCFNEWVCLEHKLICPICKKPLGTSRRKNIKSL